jgi:hypothetical protein
MPYDGGLVGTEEIDRKDDDEGKGHPRTDLQGFYKGFIRVL